MTLVSFNSQLQLTASKHHKGQGSPLYAIAKHGAIPEEDMSLLFEEAAKILKELVNLGSWSEYAELKKIYDKAMSYDSYSFNERKL